MRHEHWSGPEGEASFLVEGKSAEQLAFLREGATLCCVIEAADWVEACVRYHEHMGWEPYRPMED